MYNIFILLIIYISINLLYIIKLYYITIYVIIYIILNYCFQTNELELLHRKLEFQPTGTVRMIPLGIDNITAAFEQEKLRLFTLIHHAITRIRPYFNSTLISFPPFQENLPLDRLCLSIIWKQPLFPRARGIPRNGQRKRRKLERKGGDGSLARKSSGEG